MAKRVFNKELWMKDRAYTEEEADDFVFPTKCEGLTAEECLELGYDFDENDRKDCFREVGDQPSPPMMQRQLNEQWVEEIDGKKHMLKALPCKDGLPCHGCDFGYFDMDEQHVRVHTCKCKIFCDDNGQYIIKDLGILNEDGCLPNCWGSYPLIEENKIYGLPRHFRCLSRDGVYCTTNAYPTKQEAIDAWNRRA